MAMTFPSSPTVGQTYSVSGGPTYTWAGSVWKVLTPGQQYLPTIFTATAGQTTFTISGGYVIGAIDVFRNGVKLVSGSDYTATDLSTVVLSAACSAGDTVEVIKLAQILYTDALKKTGDTMTGALAVPNLSYTGTLTGGTGIINIGSGQIYKDAAGKLGINTNLPDSDLDIYGSGQRLFKAKAISQLGIPNLGTYKGYLLLAKAYTSGIVDQSHVNGTFYLKRGGTSSGNRTDVYVVSSNTAYGSDNLLAQTTSTGSNFFSKTCKVTYGGVVYHAIETSQTGGSPDQGVWFTGTFANCAPIYVDASYVSSITDYGSSTNIWNADGAGNGSVLELNNGVMALPKGQLKFPATQNASSDANTLDDYEEGTWTPTLANFTGTAGWTASGTYVKIGRIVYLDVTLSPGSGTISATSNVSYISGLPFSVSRSAVVGWSSNYIETLGAGVIYPGSNFLYTSTFSINNLKTIYSSGVYNAST